MINLSSISAIFWKTTFKHQTRAIRFCKDPVLQVCFLHPRFVLGKDIELEKRPVVFLDRLARHALAFRLNYHALICGHLGAAVSFTSVKSKHQKLFRKSVTANRRDLKAIASVKKVKFFFFTFYINKKTHLDFVTGQRQTTSITEKEREKSHVVSYLTSAIYRYARHRLSLHE